MRDRGFSRTRKGSGYKFGKDVTRTEVLAARDALFADLQQFRKDADADLAACLQQELAGATARYQALKAAAGSLDFADLLVARARSDRERRRRSGGHLQRKFTRIFVDEFQDTDPIQAEILLLLAADDPAATDCDQRVRPCPASCSSSAIRSRRSTGSAAPTSATYWRVSRQLEHVGRPRAAADDELSQRAGDPAIRQRGVRRGDDRRRADAAGRLRAAVAPHRADDDSQPADRRAAGAEAVLGTRTVEGVGEGDRGVAARCGRRVHRVADRRAATAGRSRSAAPTAPNTGCRSAARHIAVLFRRFVSFGEDVTRTYIDAIEARGIPHLLVGGKAFHDREEVETIRAALAAIEWPDDELSVFATLQGSLFADRRCSSCSSSAIGSASLHPFRVPRELGGNSGQDLALTGEPTTQLTPIADALRLLQQLHRRRNYRPVADTIGRLLAETRAHVGFILRPAGEQALANVLHVAELARQYEAGGGISFRGFIDELRTAVGARGGRSADPRREQRRRAVDDGAQGQGPRVSGGHPRRSDLPAEPRATRAAISMPKRACAR